MLLVFKLRPETSTELAFSILSRRFGLLVVIAAHLSTVLLIAAVSLNTVESRAMGLHSLINIQRHEVIKQRFE